MSRALTKIKLIFPKNKDPRHDEEKETKTHDDEREKERHMMARKKERHMMKRKKESNMMKMKTHKLATETMRTKRSEYTERMTFLLNFRLLFLLKHSIFIYVCLFNLRKSFMENGIF